MALTEKGKQALTSIIQQFNPHEEFTAKDAGFHSATLTALVKNGYLQKVENSSPVIYFYNEEGLAAFKGETTDFPSFEPYSMQEYNKQKTMRYYELVNYLLVKYGCVRYPYFATETMKTKTRQNGRGKEGLYIHHIYEKDYIDLSKPSPINRWEFQQPANLVYCNIYEHLLLHMKICEEWKKETAANLRMMVGVGGVLHHIVPVIHTKTSPAWMNITFLEDFPLEEEVKSFQTRLCNTEFYEHFQESVDDFGDFWKYATDAKVRRNIQLEAMDKLIASMFE